MAGVFKVLMPCICQSYGRNVALQSYAYEDNKELAHRLAVVQTEFMVFAGGRTAFCHGVFWMK